MYKAKDGKAFHNPAIGRQHDRDAAAGKKPEVKREPEIADGGSSSGEPHKVEIYHPDAEDNPSPGKHHTMVRDAEGNEDHQDHESAEEAHAHVAPGGNGDDQEFDEHHLGDPEEDGGEAQAETCPECGGEMQGGVCEECGYSADENAIAGHGQDEREEV